MSQTTVTWVKDQTFIGTDSTEHSVVVSSPADGVGMKPSELLLSALGSCTGYDVVNILTKRRKHLTGLTITIKAEQESDPPWMFTCFHMHYVVRGFDLAEDEVKRAIELSEQKYCSVSATLSKAAKITYDFEVINESDERIKWEGV